MPENGEPSDEELKQLIHKLLPAVDLNNTGIKRFTKMLASELGGDVDLKSRAPFIKEALTEAINALDEEEAEDSESEVSEEEEKPVIATKQPKKEKGLNTRKEISGKLAAFLRKGKFMARTEVVKCLWDYIKENELQNPKNRREIILDDALRKVFGCDTFTMFSMNKYISSHIHPFKPLDLSSSSTPKKRKNKSSSSDGSAKKKRKTKKPGLQPPYRLSEDLAAVVGASILPRPQVVAGLWSYIRANGLQNPQDGREIMCDDKLRAVMGKKKVTMFTMNKLISNHILEKVDRSEYTHEEASAGQEEEEDDEDEEDEDEED